MLNDWKWEKVDECEYVIRDDNNAVIIFLIQTWNNQWKCCLYNDYYNITYQAIFPENTSVEEVQWQVIVWANNQCNNVANSFHYIRDHLPDVHDLFDKIKKS